MHNIIRGKATKIALFIKLRNAPLKDLIANKGIHPTGEVFLIMKEKVSNKVVITTFLSNLLLIPKKK